MVLIAIALRSTTPVHALNITVTSLGDEPDAAINGVCATAAGTCTLRAAIQEANAVGGGDSITFSVTGTITLGSSLPAITGPIDITGPGASQLTVDANNTGTIFQTSVDSSIKRLKLTRASTTAVVITAGFTTITETLITNNAGGGISVGNARLRVYDSVISSNQGTGIQFLSTFVSGASSTIELSWIEGNSGSGVVYAQRGNPGLVISTAIIRNNAGTGIVNAGDINLSVRMEVTGSLVSGNTGSGISNGGGVLTVTNSIVSGNTSAGSGGGIASSGGLTVTGSTISGNSAASGGGLFLGSHEFQGSTVTNSTISGNTATVRGGASWSDNRNGMSTGGLTFKNSTISGNQAPAGGASSLELGNGGGAVGGTLNRVSFTQSTVVNNTATTGAAVHSTGTAGGFGNGVGAFGSIFSNNGPNCSVVGTPNGSWNISSDNTCAFSGSDNLDNTAPSVGPLANNGGLTETHALLPGSPAIDRVPSSFCSGETDQRGTARPQGPGCDVGAFEVFVAPPPPVNAPSSVSANLTSASSINLTFTDNATDETGFEIERKINNGPYGLLVDLGPQPGAQSGWSHADNGLGANLTFCYRMRAKRGTIYSAYSNESCALTSNSGTCTAVSLSSNPPAGSITTGSTQTFTATASCGGVAVYRWWVWQASNGWAPQGPYGSNNTFAWTPPAPGESYVAVWVQTHGKPENTFDKDAFVQRIVTPTAPCTSVTYTSNPPSASINAGSLQTFTATATCSGTPVYRWWVWSPATGWVAQGQYGTNNTFAWTPTTPGQYYVAVWVQNQGGNPNSFDRDFYLQRTVTAATPCSSVSFTSNPPSAAIAANTTQHFTASAACPGTPVYRWWVWTPSTGWVAQTQYSTSNAFAWTPTTPGQYYVAVWLQNQGGPAGSFDKDYYAQRTVN